MTENTDSTANGTKFAPMPMSALLASLMPLQRTADSPDASFTSEDESDNSFSETVAKKPSPNKRNNGFRTPNSRVTPVNRDIKGYTSERKITTKVLDKENLKIDLSNLTYPNKNGNKLHSVQDNVKSTVQPTPEIKNKGILTSHNHNTNNSNNHQDRLPPEEKYMLNKLTINKTCSVVKKTPEVCKYPSSNQKTKTATPKIKTGIRKFTPSSAKLSYKKSAQKGLIQNRDKVRCELFGQNKSKDEIQCPHPRPETAPAPVPQTPMSMKPMPSTYAATPSHPQLPIGNNSKILFKTTSIKDKKYLFIKKLGTGGSSEVYKVLEVGTSCEYAVKCVYLATDHELAQGYINEVRLLRELQNSDRVVRLYDYEYDRANQFLRMVLEVGETDLSSFLRARGSGLPPALVLHYWEEMLHAVGYIHEHGVIHADLKPANFLLVCGRLKLIDFGIASAISGDATSVVRAQATGTYSYISPEALMGGAGGYGRAHGEDNAPIKISFRSDVWSLGCILYSMVYGRTPFGHIPNLAKLAAILDPNHKIDYPPVEHLPASLVAALKWCLTYNARARPSVAELLRVPYLDSARAPYLDSARAPYLDSARAPLPQHLLDKLQPLLDPADFRLLQQARI